MALVVSVLCAVSPRITVDTSLISLCTSKNRELRKLTTPEEWRRVGSGCLFLEIIQSQINPNGYSSHLVHLFNIYLSEKMNFGTFQISFRWFMSKLVNCSNGYVFQTVFLCNISIPKLLKNSRTFGSTGKIFCSWELGDLHWRFLLGEEKIEQWNKLGRRWTRCLTSIICKGWLGRCLSMAVLLEQWKKSWLFRAYTGLYSPIMWGLS